MAQIIPCKSCVYKGTAKDGITSICRRASPSVATPAGHSGQNNHMLAVWPAVDPDNDGCGQGSGE